MNTYSEEVLDKEARYLRSQLAPAIDKFLVSSEVCPLTSGEIVINVLLSLQMDVLHILCENVIETEKREQYREYVLKCLDNTINHYFGINLPDRVKSTQSPVSKPSKHNPNTRLRKKAKSNVIPFKKKEG